MQWSMAETLKTVNNVRMMINNRLAVLIFTLHQVEGIQNYTQEIKIKQTKTTIELGKNYGTSF